MNAQDVKLRHSHYHKSVAGLEMVDIYRVLVLFNVTDPCIGHAIKKLLVAGGRGAGKDIQRDVSEAIDTLVRWKDMRQEDAGTALKVCGLEPVHPCLRCANLSEFGGCTAAQMFRDFSCHREMGT